MSTPPDRRPAHGDGRKAKQYARRSYDFQHKLAVIDQFKLTNSIDLTVTRYFPGLDAIGFNAKRKQIYKWEQERATIEQQVITTTTASARRTRAK